MRSVAGSPYHITATLSSTPAGALDNYIITNLGADFTINKKALSVNAVAASKTYGDPDRRSAGPTAASSPARTRQRHDRRRCRLHPDRG